MERSPRERPSGRGSVATPGGAHRAGAARRALAPLTSCGRSRERRSRRRSLCSSGRGERMERGRSRSSWWPCQAPSHPVRASLAGARASRVEDVPVRRDAVRSHAARTRRRARRRATGARPRDDRLRNRIPRAWERAGRRRGCPHRATAAEENTSGPFQCGGPGSRARRPSSCSRGGSRRRRSAARSRFRSRRSRPETRGRSCRRPCSRSRARRVTAWPLVAMVRRAVRCRRSPHRTLRPSPRLRRGRRLAPVRSA